FGFLASSFSRDISSSHVVHHHDPYLNTDAGTMSPFEHAEVLVLYDSGEFVIEKERRGDYGRGEVKLGQPWGSLLRLLKI
ncbi:hypothetical protein VIGAN_04209200, partial [Vigna angularis var. angularis]